MAENNELRILNSFLTKGSFILSQELELVDRFLGKYDTQIPFSNKLGGGSTFIKGRKEMVCAIFIMLHVPRL